MEISLEYTSGFLVSYDTGLTPAQDVALIITFILTEQSNVSTRQTCGQQTYTLTNTQAHSFIHKAPKNMAMSLFWGELF